MKTLWNDGLKMHGLRDLLPSYIKFRNSFWQYNTVGIQDGTGCGDDRYALISY